MKRLSRLFVALDSTTSTNARLDALAAYFSSTPPEDAVWAVFFLSGRRLQRLLPMKLLRRWSTEAAGLPEWMFAECYEHVGDLAETMALLGNRTQTSDWKLSGIVSERVTELGRLPEPLQREVVLETWSGLSELERFLYNKLLTGAFRVGVSRRMVTRALARSTGRDVQDIAHRLMGPWDPTPEFFESLSVETKSDLISRPYPFFLANQLDDPPEQLGDPLQWLAEWKWDGIRAQIVRRGGERFIWSRGEELVNQQFPELDVAATRLPDGTVMDGEILAWKDGSPLPFGDLQKRLGRKRLTRKLLTDVPVSFIAFDLIECGGEDLRDRELVDRRSRLTSLLQQFSGDRMLGSPEVNFREWQALEQLRAESRDRHTEGLMLKRRDSAYGVGRERGAWWKWKIEPHTIDAVLLYAQRGHGKRATLYTDYTFGVWKGDELLPFAKAYSGLTNEEIEEVDRFIRNNGTTRFGPVRGVKPELVFEIAFENVRESSRHKSGVAVRFPRIVRWRRDLKPSNADSLESVRRLIPGES